MIHELPSRTMEFVLWLAEKASTLLREASTAEIREKSESSDLQTDYDIRVEDMIRAEIEQAYPTHAIQGEERGVSGDLESVWRWYIDPIDGTCNFANGLPWYSVSIALFRGEEPVVGAITAPALREVYYATAGGGAYLNGRPIRIQQSSGLRGGVVLMELANHRRWDGFDDIMRMLEAEYCTLRVMGSSALALAQLAAGRACGVALGGSNPIDVGAGVLIAREAGATVLDPSGRASGFPVGGLTAGTFAIAEMLWRAGTEARNRSIDFRSGCRKNEGTDPEALSADDL